jgi:hypothetical protein
VAKGNPAGLGRLLVRSARSVMQLSCRTRNIELSKLRSKSAIHFPQLGNLETPFRLKAPPGK